MKKTKLPSKFWFALTIFSLVGQVAWVVENMYFNVFIYKMFHASADEISLMVSASAISATLTTILIGALSDKIGKRKLFICSGYILWGISIWSFSLIRMDIIDKLFPMTVSAATVGVSLVIIMDCVMTFFGSAANDACFNAWLTDVTDDTNRGAAEGINSMMPLVAILVVFGGFMGFDLNKAESWTLIYQIIGIVVFILGILAIFLVQDVPVDTSNNKNYFGNIFYGFRPSVIKQNKLFYIILTAYAMFCISIQIFMPYLILYYNVSLGLENYVLIMAPAVIVAAIVTACYGKVYDRFHFKAAVIPAISILMLGYILLYLFKATSLVFIGSLFMMSGYLMGMAVFGAMLRDYTPANRAGMFQGLRIVGQVLVPGIVGPAIGATVLKNADTVLNDDGTHSFIPNANIFLAALIAACFIWLVLALIFKLIKKGKGD
ncbi:MAG: MFS transporter [Tyzzerella sp.]|nr:MFS transporter [Tyzzerella sp.]